MPDNLTKDLLDALRRVQQLNISIPKTKLAKIPGKGDRQGYEFRYADLATVLDMIRPTLAAEGLVAVQCPTSSQVGTVATVGVRTTIYHPESLGCITGEVSMPVVGDARAVGSCITYLRRYALVGALCLVSDDDMDGQDVETTDAGKDLAAAQQAQALGDLTAYMGAAEALALWERIKTEAGKNWRSALTVLQAEASRARLELHRMKIRDAAAIAAGLIPATPITSEAP